MTQNGMRHLSQFSTFLTGHRLAPIFTTGTYNLFTMRITHFQYENLARGTVDIEFTVCRIIWIDALAGQEVDYILWTILVTIGCRHLHVQYVGSRYGREKRIYH